MVHKKTVFILNYYFICTSPNLQKLTYQLLQQRLKRQFDFVERSTHSIGKISVCDTPSPSQQNPSSCSNHVVDTCDNLDNNLSSFYTKQDGNNACSSAQARPQIEPNRRTKPASFRTLYPSTTTIPQPSSINSRLVNSKNGPTTHKTLLSYYSPKQYHISSTLEHRLKNNLITLISSNNNHYATTAPLVNASNLVKSFIRNKYNLFTAALFKDTKPKKQRKMLPKRVVRQEFAIQCMAKSEFIAAGKLNYILSDVSYMFYYK